MRLAEYRSCDATALAGLVRGGLVKPEELLEAALESFAQVNPELNAVVHVMEDEARQAVAGGLPAGAFQGVPFLIKDLWIKVAGAATTNGSRLFADAAPAGHDSVVVRRHRQAGLVIFGKTNTPEFGLSPSTEPLLHGPTLNPVDPTRSAGGSSGGSAAAVAAGIVPFAHATDGGGSIRIPASCCGLFGLKPTRGRVTFSPEKGEGWAGMSHQHAVTRTVRDSAALLDATAGPAPGDPYAAAPPEGTFLMASERPPGRLRVGLATAPPSGIGVDPECVRAAQDTAALLERLGHAVEAVDWPPGLAGLIGLAQAGIVRSNIAASVAARLRDLGRALGEADLEPMTMAMVGSAAGVSAVEYIDSVAAMHQVGRHMAGLFADIDVLVTPTMACLPPPIGQVNMADTNRYMSNAAPMAAFTAVFNMSGQPAASLPLHRTGDGLPVGAQIAGRYGEEAVLLSLSAQIEAAHPWA
jgi:Asp-tRNA(Asn)/Glu-tRNA(Gln) amidotransferase A subunit family amidase